VAAAAQTELDGVEWSVACAARGEKRRNIIIIILFIMVKTQRSTSQQSVTQHSRNNQDYPKGCQKQTAPRYCQHPIRWAFTSQALTRWRHLSTEHTSD